MMNMRLLHLTIARLLLGGAVLLAAALGAQGAWAQDAKDKEIKELRERLDRLEKEVGVKKEGGAGGSPPEHRRPGQDPGGRDQEHPSLGRGERLAVRGQCRRLVHLQRQ